MVRHFIIMHKKGVVNRYSIATDIQIKDDHQLEIVSKKHHID